MARRHPVDRSRRANLVEEAAARLRGPSHVPGGAAVRTRSRAAHWKSGFYHIARTAQVPIVCAFSTTSARSAGSGRCSSRAASRRRHGSLAGLLSRRARQVPGPRDAGAVVGGRRGGVSAGRVYMYPARAVRCRTARPCAPPGPRAVIAASFVIWFTMCQPCTSMTSPPQTMKPWPLKSARLAREEDDQLRRPRRMERVEARLGLVEHGVVGHRERHARARARRDEVRRARRTSPSRARC